MLLCFFLRARESKRSTLLSFCVKALGIPKGDACRSALPLSQSEATERTIGTQECYKHYFNGQWRVSPNSYDATI